MFDCTGFENDEHFILTGQKLQLGEAAPDFSQDSLSQTDMPFVLEGGIGCHIFWSRCLISTGGGTLYSSCFFSISSNTTL